MKQSEIEIILNSVFSNVKDNNPGIAISLCNALLMAREHLSTRDISQVKMVIKSFAGYAIKSDNMIYRIKDKDSYYIIN